jgi:predicted nucleic acid-binding protein
MILVDTAVWVDHLRNGNDALSGLLVKDEVVCHPMVIGELAYDS